MWAAWMCSEVGCTNRLKGLSTQGPASGILQGSLRGSRCFDDFCYSAGGGMECTCTQFMGDTVSGQGKPRNPELPWLAGTLGSRNIMDFNTALYRVLHLGLQTVEDEVLWERTWGLDQWQIKSESMVCACARKGQQTSAISAREQTAGWGRWVFPLVKGREYFKCCLQFGACWETVVERQVQQSSEISLWRLMRYEECLEGWFNLRKRRCIMLLSPIA